MGKYYTPSDVSMVMSSFLRDLNGDNVCDVACGTGNLIMGYLKDIGIDEARRLVNDGKVYLYDVDSIAMMICRHSIGKLVGTDVVGNVHCVQGDFLSKDIVLPDNCKVVSNPPYRAIKQVPDDWEDTEVVRQSRDYYAAFMEKIIRNSTSSVMLTPFGFLGSDKFSALRNTMVGHTGAVFAFDNVPSSIFGRKHGVFNTNSSNSVRAAITVINDTTVDGFRVSPLIRFQSDERDRLLRHDTLMGLLPDVAQSGENRFFKCFKELERTHEQWVNNATGTFHDMISDTPTDYVLTMPTTCRYYTSAAYMDLNRSGKRLLYFKDKESQSYAYCLLNSSFAYWYWRLYDGGVVYPLNLLYDVPINFDVSDMDSIAMCAEQARVCEPKFLSYKKNAGKMQENLKFSKDFRSSFNTVMGTNLGITTDLTELDVIHQNHIFARKDQ